MNILHIHQDYPDGRPSPYTHTKAVSNLIEGCEKIDATTKHIVVSINRTSNPLKVGVQPFDKGFSFVYWAIPLPYIYYVSMWLSAFYIHQKIKHLKFDVIHGHKLTCEGVLAYFLAKKMNKPYVLSIRGGSDMHNVKRLSVHNRFFRKVFYQARQIFWVSAWAKQPIQKALAIAPQRIAEGSLLPNICKINLAYLHQAAELRNGYVTVISYHQYKRKGLIELIEAITLLNQQNQSFKLNIYGSGDAVYKTKIESIIAQFKAESCVHLKGQVTQQVLLSAMSQSKGFLLPAVNETFGMAYIEALSVGCPILYVANTGVDGYFNDVCVGEKITTLNIEKLTESIEKIDQNNILLCELIKKCQDDGLLLSYISEQVANNYLNSLNSNSELRQYD